MADVNLKIERVPGGFTALEAGDVVAIPDERAQDLMRSGVVFCVTGEPATREYDVPVSDRRDRARSDPTHVLDLPIAGLAGALKAFDVPALHRVLNAEVAGKTRKGAVDAIKSEIEARG